MADTTIANLRGRKRTATGLPPSRSTELPADQPAENPPVGLRLSVAWGDFARTPADIHVVGHYQGVLPVSAEKALDTAISGDRGLIAEHTRRGWISGVLGELRYFPAPDPDDAEFAVRRAAVAGMGRPGTFSEPRAVQLYASILRALLSLRSVRRAAVVLIGSGAGNLSAAQTARALVSGFAAALQAASAADVGLTEVVVVEIDRLRAEQLHTTLAAAAKSHSALTVADQLTTQAGGDVGLSSALALSIRLLGTVARDPARVGSLAALLEDAPEDIRSTLLSRLAELPDDHGVLSVSVGNTDDSSADNPPTCISVTQGDKGTLRWTALTGRATIPERQVAVNQQLMDQVVERLTAPVARDAHLLPLMLTRFVVPVDLQQQIAAETALILEVDAATARVSWEFLTDEPDDTDRPPLAVRTPIARQMRTTYSRIATDELTRPRRALVVADPGDPAMGHSLPAAKQEGRAVAAALRGCGLDVKLFVGAPGTVSPSQSEPAALLDVLTELLVGGYQIVHFAGHGAFDPDRPELAGWVFANGLLTARELSQLTDAPRLIVANACWSAARPGGRSSGGAHPSDLTPVLADEFLRAGAGHYIGASWVLPDDLAEQFATTFYGHLLGLDGRVQETIGRSLCAARRELFDRRGPDAASSLPERWSAWAAYQHYGDPGDLMTTTGSARLPASGLRRSPS